jgi:hypothetical protein
VYHEIESAEVVGEVGRLGDDVVGFLEFFYVAFGSVEGYDGSIRAGDIIFYLNDA